MWFSAPTVIIIVVVVVYIVRRYMNDGKQFRNAINIKEIKIEPKKATKEQLHFSSLGIIGKNMPTKRHLNKANQLSKYPVRFPPACEISMSPFSHAQLLQCFGAVVAKQGSISFSRKRSKSRKSIIFAFVPLVSAIRRWFSQAIRPGPAHTSYQLNRLWCRFRWLFAIFSSPHSIPLTVN